MSPRRPIEFVAMFLSATEVFGKEMDIAILRDRIRSFNWKGSVARLAQLAAMVGNPVVTDEDVRRRTIDPILEIDGSARDLIQRARAYVARNRDRMTIAHEEVLNLLEHLAVVDGGDGGEPPSDAELSFWLLGANCHLGRWAEADSRALTVAEELIAVQVRGHCFNRHYDWLALAVRSYELFRQCPRDPAFDETSWTQFQLDTFGVPFETYFARFLFPLLALAMRSGDLDEQRQGHLPAVSVEYWETVTGIDTVWIQQRLNALAVTPDDVRAQLEAAPHGFGEGGLPHAPTVLRRRPLINGGDGFLISSPWNVAQQFFAGPWGAYLERMKHRYGDREGFFRWSNAFGYAFEKWCVELARATGDSEHFRARTDWRVEALLAPGGQNEIEDVVLVEGNTAILFSVKSAMLPEGQVHRAKSRSAVLDWLDRFLFSADRNFKGAITKLSAKVDLIRGGDQPQLPRDIRILPVLVTYDEFGEDVLLYRQIRHRCRDLRLLQQPQVAPLTIASVEEYEGLMSYAQSGRSAVGLLKKRKNDKPWFDRRLDQQLAEIRPTIGRPPLVDSLFERIYGEVMTSIGGDLDEPENPTSA